MWTLILQILLLLLKWAAGNSGDKEIETTAIQELEILQGRRVRRAADARNSVQLDDDTSTDPNRRD